MAVVNPTPVPALGTALPDPTDRTTYGPRGRAVFDWETSQLVPGINQLAQDTYANALASEDAVLASVAAANFKGAWSSLTGALNKPASVYHSGTVWALLNNLANVASSQPGVSADWVDIGGVKRSGDAMAGPLSVPAGASGSQVGRVSEVAPPGLVALFAMSSAPAGWLKANGAAVSRATYAALFAAVGTTFGAGDGSTTFNLPDLRGEFLRGWDDGRGVDSGRAIGSAQADGIKQSTFWMPATQNGNGRLVNGQTGEVEVTQVTSNAWSVQANATAGTRADVTIGTAPETRPRNRALLVCIKF